MPFADADITVHWSTSGARAQTHFAVIAAPQLELVEIADGVENAVRRSIRRMMASVWTLDRVIAKNGASDAESASFTQAPNPFDGVPCNSTFLVTKHSVVGHNGRMYLPGLDEDQVGVDGHLVAANYDDAQNRCRQLLVRLDENGLAMVMRRPNGDLDLVDALILRRVAGRQDRRLQRSRLR